MIRSPLLFIILITSLSVTGCSFLGNLFQSPFESAPFINPNKFEMRGVISGKCQPISIPEPGFSVPNASETVLNTPAIQLGCLLPFTADTEGIIQVVHILLMQDHPQYMNFVNQLPGLSRVGASGYIKQAGDKLILFPEKVHLLK